MSGLEQYWKEFECDYFMWLSQLNHNFTHRIQEFVFYADMAAIIGV